MNRHGYVLYLVLLVVLSGTPASAELYQYTDEKGNVVFSDNPPAGVKAPVKPLRQEGVYQAQGGTQHTLPQEDASGPDAAEAGPYRKPYAGVDVIMYSTNWCGYPAAVPPRRDCGMSRYRCPAKAGLLEGLHCPKARSLINSLGVSLTEYDIGTVPGKRKEMRRFTRSTPDRRRRHNNPGIQPRGDQGRSRKSENDKRIAEALLLPIIPSE
ncbi:MAG TPA: hypothetical protein DCO77_03890 [Nitrospiraceae bacterium]|nr:hypothetical protein [Nitrospiraceae bacterium]